MTENEPDTVAEVEMETEVDATNENNTEVVESESEAEIVTDTAEPTVSQDLKNIIEAVLLASDGAVSVPRIQGLFEEQVRPEAVQIHAAIDALSTDFAERGVEVKKIGSGYRFQTREKYAEYLRKLYAVKPPKMSRALLETLAIIAYRQPVSRGDIEEVRGVAVSADMMQRLLERGWVKQVGVRDVPGRPALFGTTAEFLSYFSLSSLKDLPSLSEERALGEIAGEMDTPLPKEVLDALEAKNYSEEEEQDELPEDNEETSLDDGEEVVAETGVDESDGDTESEAAEEELSDMELVADAFEEELTEPR